MDSLHCKTSRWPCTIQASKEKAGLSQLSRKRMDREVRTEDQRGGNNRWYHYVTSLAQTGKRFNFKIVLSGPLPKVLTLWILDTLIVFGQLTPINGRSYGTIGYDFRKYVAVYDEWLHMNKYVSGAFFSPLRHGCEDTQLLQSNDLHQQFIEITARPEVLVPVHGLQTRLQCTFLHARRYAIVTGHEGAKCGKQWNTEDKGRRVPLLVRSQQQR